MVTNIELTQIARFVVQLSGVVAGAAALWCLVFSCKARMQSNRQLYRWWHRVAFLLAPLFWGALTLFIVGWWLSALLLFPADATAHEGVVHGAAFPTEYVVNGFRAGLPWMAALSIFTVAVGWLYRRRRVFVRRNAVVVFGTAFVLLSIVVSLTMFKGVFDTEQLALSLHNWHSFLTLGTVIVIDFLYLFTLRRNDLKRVLYPFFPWLSVAIWLGLGLDFISSFFVFDNAFPATNQFLFNQIVIAVLVINGAILSVRVNDILIGLIEKTTVRSLPQRTERIVRISGSVSIISWFTVTFLDFVEITASLTMLLGVYLVFIVLVYLTNPFFERTVLHFERRLEGGRRRKQS